MTIRVAVIGAGHHGEHHVRLLRKMKDVELVAAVDIDETQREKITEKYSVNVRKDYHEVLSDVDAVSIVVPTELHFQVASDCLREGIHVLLEKPMTRSIENSRKLVEYARNNDAIFQIGHIERFNQAVQSLLEQLDAPPKYIECDRLSPFRFRSADIDVVLDVMIHDLDILCAVVSEEVDSVESIGLSLVTSHKDIAHTRISYDSGCVANVSASRVSVESTRKMRLFSREAYYSLDFQKQELKSYRRPTELENLSREKIDEFRRREKKGELDTEQLFKSFFEEEKEVQKNQDVEPLRLELEEFIQAIREKNTPPVSGEDGLKVMELAHQIQNNWK